ncbi:MAG: TIGR02453 family protein, partial [Myxococcales bacterium]|nr:TIGR02453 family protein [Myxococcales bacterium]
MPATSTNPFRPALFAFLRELQKNNRREWFEANKSRYEDHLKDPALTFISEIGPRLAKVSPHFNAIPKATGGSLFRIYRDTRFSKDKTPYKTHLGIQFRHKQAKDVHAQGFYLHVEPGGSSAMGGS